MPPTTKRVGKPVKPTTSPSKPSSKPLAKATSKSTAINGDDDDDFIMTVDSDQEDLEKDVQDNDDNNDDLIDPISTKKTKAHLAGLEKIREPIKSKSKGKKATGEEAGAEMILDQGFEFDIYGDGSTERNGWDMTVQGSKGGNRFNVDEIIEKRRKKIDIKLPLMEEEEEEEDQEEIDQDVLQARFNDLDDSDQEMDEFGGGARKRKLERQSQDQEEEDQQDPDSADDPVSSDDDDDENDNEDDDQDEDEDDTDSSDEEQESDRETEAVKAKKAAYFAVEQEDPTKQSKANSSELTVASFSTFSLSRPLLRALSSLSFHQPTPIQTRTIPIALAGKDVVAGAVTGSGKTAAFLIPILERLSWRSKTTEEAKTRVLILAPTRELAIQCFSVGKSIGKFTDIRFCLCVGGLSLKSQEAELKLRPEVVIATPGRLIDHVRNSVSFSLDDIEILVMDEADRMLEDGFADELNEIVQSCPKNGRQTMLFSATMTDDVEQLVRLSLQKPVRLFVDPKRTTAKRLIQEFVRVRGGEGDEITNTNESVQASRNQTDISTTTTSKSNRKREEAHRPALLLSLCTRTFTHQVIIFVRSKKLAHQLKIVFGLLGMTAGELHGDLSQEQRIEALESFRDGKTDFLIATDLASRGLDIRGVQTVINYDMPGQFEQYLHRVGRTARAGRNGRAVTLVGEADRKMLKTAIKKSPPEQVKHRLIPSQIVNQMVETLEKLKPEIDQVLKQEVEEKAIHQAEMQLVKGENMIKHREEILSRPKRTWFQTEREKEQAKDVSKAEHVAKLGKSGADRFAGLSRKKKRNKMMREEMELENNQGATDAAVRVAKRSLKPTKLGMVPNPPAFGNKKKRSGGGGGRDGGKTKSSFQNRKGGGSQKSGFKKDISRSRR